MTPRAGPRDRPVAGSATYVDALVPVGSVIVGGVLVGAVTVGAVTRTATC